MANWTDRFQPVEYISSVGYQFTNTLVKSAPDIRIDARIKYDPFISSASYHGVNAEDNKLYIGKNASGKFSFGYADLDIASSVDADSNLHKFSIDCKNKKYSIDGVETSITGSGEFTGGEYIYMFGSNDGNFEATSNTSKIYGFNIYKNDILIRHFVPVKALSASRNLITHAMTYHQYTNNGITVDQNGDYFYINGTATADAVINVDENESHFIQQLDGGNFTACTSVDIPEGLSITFSIYQFNVLSEELFTLDSTHPTGTAEIEITSAMRNFTKIVVSFKVANGDTVNVDNLALQLERGSTSNGYEPFYANTVGLMYETVEGKVYIDDYIGTYTAGPSVKIIDSVKAISIMKDGEPKSVKKIERNGKLIWSNWRSNFDELEYIQSTGTQYIDTGITGKSSLEISGEIKTPASNNDMKAIFGSGNPRCYVQTSGDVWSFGANDYSNQGQIQANKKINFYANFGNESVLKIDGETISTIDNQNPYSNNFDIYLFSRNNVGTIDNYSKHALYSMSIKDNSTTVRNFLPAKANSIDLTKEMFELGSIQGTTGTPITSDNRIRTKDFIEIQDGTSYTINANLIGYQTNIFVFEFEEDGTYIRRTPSGDSWANSPLTFTSSDTTGKIKIVVKRSDNSNMSVDDLDTTQLNFTQPVGLYDTVNNKFYTNQGTGTFIAGPLK